MTVTKEPPKSLKFPWTQRVGPAVYNYIAYVYHALGDMDAYFDFMNRALDARSVIASFVMYSPLLSEARRDPRYLGLLERIRSPGGYSKIRHQGPAAKEASSTLPEHSCGAPEAISRRIRATRPLRRAYSPPAARRRTAFLQGRRR